MDAQDMIFEFAYNMAFHDATTRNAFLKRKEEKDDDDAFHKRKAAIRGYSKSSVKSYIDSIKKGDKPDPLMVILNICDEENTTNGLTFGNVQKLVNMTAKYMFLSAYVDSDIRDKFIMCHCPMDGVMMDWVKKHCTEYGLKPIKWDTSWSQ